MKTNLIIALLLTIGSVLYSQETNSIEQNQLTEAVSVNESSNVGFIDLPYFKKTGNTEFDNLKFRYDIYILACKKYNFPSLDESEKDSNFNFKITSWNRTHPKLHEVIKVYNQEDLFLLIEEAYSANIAKNDLLQKLAKNRKIKPTE